MIYINLSSRNRVAQWRMRFAIEGYLYQPLLEIPELINEIFIDRRRRFADFALARVSARRRTGDRRPVSIKSFKAFSRPTRSFSPLRVKSRDFGATLAGKWENR